jgi:alpha-N-arabinofuranosidase
MNGSNLYRHRESPADTASVVVDPSREGDPVDERLFAKFAEHLGRNIDGGMCAQILVNATFGPWEFVDNDDHPDGGVTTAQNPDAVSARIDTYCKEWDVPNPDALLKAYQNGTAFGWAHAGDVRTTPDSSPEGDRAQRIVLDEEGGLLQRTYLPLHRTESFEVTARLRATAATPVTVGVYPPEADPTEHDPIAARTFEADREWETVKADLTVDADATEDAAYTVAITAPAGPDLVLDRVTLYPDDHVAKADPEIVEYLREAELPLLRWPGGNFVSGYHWEDGVGPVEERPSRINPAWGHVEPNLFGTAEFIDFCEAVGCEPMICVNAGDGTPAEAARWVEYCNGATDTEMGALRAEHGHPEPFDVTYWEIGNELFGRWQVGWTTPSGNVDRYRQFRESMLDVDPDIVVQACGNRNSPEDRWNEALLDGAGADAEIITDHILSGGVVHEGTDPDELFQGFMGYAQQLGREYRALREKMATAGVENPRLAITELQLFADFESNREIGHHGATLTPETMPTRLTVSEPLYFGTILHECIRMGEFVQMITHSATVNHGGGLQKHRERTWPDPAYHGHVILSSLAGGTPLGVDVACETIETSSSFGDIEPLDGVPAIDAMAVDHGDRVEVTLINRRSREEPFDLSVDVSAISPGETASVTVLSGDRMAAENTYDTPDRVSPTTQTAEVEDGRIDLELPSYSLQRISIQR